MYCQTAHARDPSCPNAGSTMSQPSPGSFSQAVESYCCSPWLTASSWHTVHLNQLRAVLEELQRAGLTTKPPQMPPGVDWITVSGIMYKKRTAQALQNDHQGGKGVPPADHHMPFWVCWAIIQGLSPISCPSHPLFQIQQER